MTTLVLPPRYTEDSITLWKAALQIGWTYERLPSWRVPGWLRDEDVVLYGEPLFTTIVAPELGLSLVEPTFDWLAQLPADYRLRDVRFTVLDEPRRLTEPTFVKPVEDKSFVAAVYDSGAALPTDDVLPGTTPVLVAEPVHWDVEFRCFVRERVVLTLSPYVRAGELAQADDGSWPATDAETQAARAFAEALLADPDVVLPPAVVLDVGIIAGRGWAVVETNSASGSGVYGCDPAQVLHVLRRASVKTAAITAADRPWIVR